MIAHLQPFRLDIYIFCYKLCSAEICILWTLNDETVKKVKTNIHLGSWHITNVFVYSFRNTLTEISPNICAVGQAHQCGLWSTSYSTSKQGSNEKLYLPSPPWLFLAQRQSECIQCALISTTYPQWHLSSNCMLYIQ